MKLTTLLKKHSIVLSKSTFKVCKEGISRMGKSIDPHHDKKHIERLFNHLSYLLSVDNNLSSMINFNILIPAICWHDVWISTQSARSLSRLLWNNLAEGIISAKIFYGYAYSQISYPSIMDIHYAIRKHSSFQIFPPRTLEAKVLVDLDKLELWNNKRFINKSDTYVSDRDIYQKYLVRFYFFYSHKMGMYFKELEEKLRKISTEFWNEVGGKNK